MGSSIELRHNAVLNLKRAKGNPVPLHEQFPLTQPPDLAGRWCSMVHIYLSATDQHPQPGCTNPSQHISLKETSTSPSQNPSSSSSSLKTNSLSEQEAVFHILRQNKCKIELETLQNRVGNANIDTAKRRECKAWLDRQSEYKIFHKNVIFI